MEPTQNPTICSKCALTPICKNQPQASCSYFELKGELKKSAIVAPKPKKSPWWKLWALVLGVLVLGLMIGAFYLGRLSMAPHVVSLLPKISRPVVTGMAPEDVVKAFLLAGQAGDDRRVLALCQPEILTVQQQNVIDFIQEAPHDLADVREIKMLTRDDRSRVDFAFVKNDGRILSAGLWLKEYQGEWRIFDLTPL